jgi:hypothetical protein
MSMSFDQRSRLGGAASIDLDAALIDFEDRPAIAECEIAARIVVLVLREDLSALGVVLKRGSGMKPTAS